MIALHARKSAEAVRVSRQTHPTRPIALALTGTDLYHDIHHDLAAQRSLQLADRLIVLHSGARRELPLRLRHKVLLVPQSAPKVRGKPRPPATDTFDVAVVAHMRKVKDPLRTARAARLLPADSRIRVLHAGRPLSDEMKRAALLEQQANPRYRWLGELPRWKARALIARSRLSGGHLGDGGWRQRGVGSPGGGYPRDRVAHPRHGGDPRPILSGSLSSGIDGGAGTAAQPGRARPRFPRGAAPAVPRAAGSGISSARASGAATPPGRAWKPAADEPRAVAQLRKEA